MFNLQGMGCKKLRYNRLQVHSGKTTSPLEVVYGRNHQEITRSKHKYQWDLIHDPQRMFALFQDEKEGESNSSSGEYVKAYIKNIRCLKQSGETFYSDASFKYNIGADKYDASANVMLLDEKKYGNVFMWTNGSEKVNASNISREGSRVIVGSKLGNFITFEVRSGDQSTEIIAENLKTYLTADNSTYSNEIEGLLAKMDGMSNIGIQIARLPQCEYKNISKARRIDYIKKLAIHDEKYENVRKLITTAPNDHAPDLFAALRTNNLFKTLDEKYTDYDYRNFYNDLRLLWESGYLETLKSKPEQLFFWPLLWSTWHCLVPYTTKLEGTESIYVKGSCSSHEETLDLFDDMILLNCETKFLGNELNAPIIIPAFFLRLGSKDNIKSVLSTTFKVGLEGVSWCIGIGELKAAWTARRVIKGIMAGYGVVTSSVKIVDNFVDFSITTETFIKNNFSNGEDFISSWKTLKPFIDYGIYTKSMLSSGVSFSNAFSTYKNSYEALRNNPKFQEAIGEDFIKLEEYYKLMKETKN